MTTAIPLTLRQGNTEKLIVTITPDDPLDSMLAVTALKVVLKTSACTLDTDPSTVTLSTPTQIVINVQVATSITATVTIPATALATSYNRFWRLDAYVGAAYRTVMYGPVTMVDL